MYFNHSLEIRKLFQVAGDLDWVSSLACKAAKHISHQPRRSLQAVSALESPQPPPSLGSNALIAERTRDSQMEVEKQTQCYYSYKLLNRNLKLVYLWLLIVHGQTVCQLSSAGGTQHPPHNCQSQYSGPASANTI